MSFRDELGKRMKEFYETIPKTKLMRRVPVAIRIDGKAFHTFTRGMEKPFDEALITAMQETMKYLCENIQGCVFGYTQSDEITLLLIDYKKLNSSAWFDYEVQKMCSVAASMATMAFHQAFHKKGAMFDARCFNIPKEEVANLIYWRQLDASRNSIQMVGQAYFSQRQLQGKSGSDIQDMLMLQKNINWNDLPVYQKRGSCCIKEVYEMEPETGCDKGKGSCGSDCHEAVKRRRWIIDREPPVFKGEGRAYIEKLIYFEENDEEEDS